ncbi:hypothetical protein FRC12_014434 [Ceratobasidium sp. 428]|nr:hypothetical protein FRC12_014434 [Ceratobasidium sp. 428]
MSFGESELLPSDPSCDLARLHRTFAAPNTAFVELPRSSAMLGRNVNLAVGNLLSPLAKVSPLLNA